MPEYRLYSAITLGCISTDPFCTPRLREELSQLSLPALYRVFEPRGLGGDFWSLTSTIFEMLHDRVSHD